VKDSKQHRCLLFFLFIKVIKESGIVQFHGDPVGGVYQPHMALGLCKITPLAAILFYNIFTEMHQMVS